jgi:hypothetical protein
MVTATATATAMGIEYRIIKITGEVRLCAGTLVWR